MDTVSAMKTTHQIHFTNSNCMTAVPSCSVDLTVTSPPYPMIEMWDETFLHQDADVGSALKKYDGFAAFERMHRLMDTVWDEVYRVLRPGGIACVNIGDATRTLGGHFMLYSNHSRILSRMLDIGFVALPQILWRKQTNAPNKFMGSGMMPPGAYVTLEHEHILVLRKGRKREFDTGKEKENRRESAFFWEERNIWFSDIWMDLKGARQKMLDKKTRGRSGAYPFELPYRLINMFSVKGDTVVDPFLGTGTTMAAAMVTGRNSIGFELEKGFSDVIHDQLREVPGFSSELIRERIEKHLEFVDQRVQARGPLKYINVHYGFPVMTRQEIQLKLEIPESVKPSDTNIFEVKYSEDPCKGYEAPETFKTPASADMVTDLPSEHFEKKPSKAVQMKLIG